MKYILPIIAATLSISAMSVEAKGGFSGGGRSSGGFSSGRSSYSAPAPSRPSVATAPPSANPNRGGFNSAQQPNRAPVAASPQARSTTTTTTTVNRSYSSNVYGGGIGYGGMGMGYGYSNGLLTGMIIGNMMHPHNTVVYTGGGVYSNNALLYPDGRVVNSSGVLVGNYTNGSFVSVPNGPVVAQPVPADAYSNQVAQPVVIKTGPSASEVVLATLAIILIVFLFIVLISML